MSRFIEPPTEKETGTLLGAISVASRFTWMPFPPDVSTDELSDHRYLDAAAWLAERSDLDDLIETFRKFRVPPETLRTCKAYPQAQIRSGKIRDQFAVHLTGVVTRFNQQILVSFSVPTPPSPSTLAPISESPFVPPARSPLAADSQCSDEPSEGSTARVDSLASTHISHQLPTPLFSASSPLVRSAAVGDRLPKFSDPSERSSFASTAAPNFT